MQSFPIHLHLNHWAILVSAVMQWLIGATWYSPMLFSKPWADILKLNVNGKPKGMWVGMVAALVGDVVLCLVLAHLVRYAGASSFGAGAVVGGMVWLGFFAAPNVAQGIYEQRPFTLFAINQGYWLVCLVLAGGLLSVWQ